MTRCRNAEGAAQTGSSPGSVSADKVIGTLWLSRRASGGGSKDQAEGGQGQVISYA